MSNGTVGDVNKSSLITIFGTGNYGIAVGKRFLKYGFKINYGSRVIEKVNNEYIKENFNLNDLQHNIKFLSITDAWKLSERIIIMAVPAHGHEELVKAFVSSCSKNHEFNEKIVIDVSNRDENKNNSYNFSLSNAELLQDYFQQHLFANDLIEVHVVKAFNNISAFVMSCEYADRSGNGGKLTYSSGELTVIACNNDRIREEITRLCEQIGFRGRQAGTLESARELEISNRETFLDWQYPTKFVFLFFLFTFSWYFFHSYATTDKYKNFKQYLSDFSILGCLNRVFAFSSINLLSYVYLAGIVASIYQLYNGNRNKRFPRYLDLWLKSRKHLGLWAFFQATLHVLITLIILDHGQYSSWYRPIKQPSYSGTFINKSQEIVINLNQGVKMTSFTFHGELNVLTGILAYFTMLLIALSSINSINASFNWSEWTLVQTKLGYVTLFLALLHDVVMYSRFILERDLHKYTTKRIFTRVKLFALWIPLIVIILKLILTYFKPISKRIENIRNGVVYMRKKNKIGNNIDIAYI